MSEKLICAVTVKMTEAQHRALHLRAEQKGTVASEYMRRLLDRDMRVALEEFQALAAIFGPTGAKVEENGE